MIIQNKPRKRFKDFDNRWNLITLDDICSVYDGVHQTPPYSKDGIPFLSVENISDLKTQKYIPEDFYQKHFKNNKPKKGDVFVTRIGSVGDATVNYYDNDVAFYVSLALLKIKDKKSVDSNFLKYLVESSNVQKDFWRKTLHIAFPKKINKNEIARISAVIPSIQEQEKIGKFFAKLDKLIILYSRKIDLEVSFNKSMLQKFFPDKNKSVPNASFTKNIKWNAKKLGNIVDFHDNKRVPIKSSDRKYGDTPYYGANGVQDYVVGKTHSGEYVLIAEDGANDINSYPIFYVTGDLWVNNHAHVLSGKNDILSTKFLTYALKTVNFSRWVTGGGRMKLNGSVLKKIPVSIPLYNEQIKIGQYFYERNKIIQKYNKKISYLKQLKKAYLQKMFC